MKKLIVIFSVAVIALMLMTVCVSAETYIDENFDANDMDVLSEVGDPTTGTNGVEWTREVTDGALHVVNTTTTTLSQTIYSSETTIPTDAVMQFDVKSDMPMTNTKGYIMMNFYRGGAGGRVRVTLRSSQIVFGSTTITTAPHEPGVWYTYYVKTYDTTAELYRKVRGSEELPVFLGETECELSHKQSSRIQPYGANGTDIWLDNLKVYAGTEVESASLEMGGSEVENLGDIDDGILNAKIDMVTSEVVKAEVDGEMREVYGDATPIIVVYDKDRKMIYSEAYTGAGVHMGENSFELSIDTSSFADQLEGGYLGFYLWDSFGSLQPIMDAIEIR